jgi:hypothetical protein
MKMPKVAMLRLACVSGLLAATSAMAAPIIDGSILNIGGQGVVSAVSLTFLCTLPGNPACTPPPVGAGDFAVANSTGSFAQYNNSFGLIKSINNFAQPLNTPISLPSFITFNLNNNVTIELTFIPLGTNTLSTTCIGIAHCTPQNAALATAANPNGISAFNLDQTQTGTTATFGIYGIARSNDGFTANLSGTFTTQFSNLTPDQALAAAFAGQTLSYSSQLSLIASSAVPEPASMFMAGFALLGIGMAARRRAAK